MVEGSGSVQKVKDPDLGGPKTDPDPQLCIVGIIGPESVGSVSERGRTKNPQKRINQKNLLV
jgi:hypothetical protein